MKKFNYLLLGAATLTMASCSQDDLLNNGIDDGLYHITVKLPDDMGTRAFGSGTTADNLYMAVYDADNDNALIYEDLTQTFGGSLTTEVGLTLVKGKSYNIAFFAMSPDAASQNVYTFNSTDANFKVNYEKMLNGSNNADAYDCFFKLYSIENFSGNTTQSTVVLQRPVAQINWGTADLNSKNYPAITNNYGPNGEYIVTGLTTQAYNTYGFFGGKDGSGDVVTNIDNAMSTVTLVDFTAPQDEQFPVEPNTYKYVAIEYLLAPQTEAIYNLTLSISNAGNQAAVEKVTNVIDVDNAPVQANYRTNIFGSLLSENVMLTVTKDKYFEGEYNDVNTAQALADAIARGGYVQLNEDLTVSNDIIIKNKVTLNLNGHSITYTGTEEGMFYIINGGDVTITGDGNISSDKYYTPIWVNGGVLTIEGGNYWAPDQTGQIVYVENGTAYIKGGTFELENMEYLNKPQYYPINCKDENYRDGKANIYVSGGLFYLFNPGDSPSEGKPYVNFLEAGYESQAVTINGETWYAVVPNGTTVVGGSDTSTIIKNGGSFMLSQDVTYNSNNYIPLTKNTNLDLNGFTLGSYGNSSTGDALVVGNGANVTISNGTLTPAKNALADGSSATINLMTPGGGTLVLDNVTVIGDMYPVMLTSASPDAEIIINSGEFYWTEKWDGSANTDKDVAVYVTGKGHVTINGGIFGKPGCYSEFLLNIQDAKRYPNTDVMPVDIITVKGGTFINFNPANNRAEGAGTNFVAPGYKVISQKVGNDTYYTVVPQ